MVEKVLGNHGQPLLFSQPLQIIAGPEHTLLEAVSTLVAGEFCSRDEMFTLRSRAASARPVRPLLLTALRTKALF